MELKRILARDTRSATEQAIRLYGEDVLIVANHRVGQQTELVVAVDVPLQAPAAEHSQAVQTQTQGAAFRQHFEQVQPGFAASSAPLPISAPSDDRDRVRSQEIVALVREELADLRREFWLSQRSTPLHDSMQWDDAMLPMVECLRECAMPGALRTLLLDSLQGHSDVALATQSLRQQLIAAVGSPEAGMPARGVHVLSGPAGSGKTTMAARLAQWGAQELGCDQVALVSYRDQRAGAWSQMQILGAQAGVEVFRAMDAATLALLLSDIGHRALVVIDTPGVQIHEHVQSILSVCPQAQLHAVLAADSSEATCRRVLGADEFARAALMVSKLDEADAPWSLLQFLCNSTTPPARSLLSCSSRLAQDMQAWCVDDLVDHALQVSGLMPLPSVQVSNPIPTPSFGVSDRDLNG